MLSFGNTRPVTGGSDIFARHPVDERRFAHIGNPDDQRPARPRVHTFGNLPVNFVLKQQLHLLGNLFDACACSRVYRMGNMALRFEKGQPFPCSLRICQVRLIQNNQPWLVPQNIVNHRIAAGKRQTGIEQFYTHINQLQLILDLPPSLRHMTRKPLNGHCRHLL
ncbi:hypothetical protein D3C86_1755450 [compost metagenome]